MKKRLLASAIIITSSLLAACAGEVDDRRERERTADARLTPQAPEDEPEGSSSVGVGGYGSGTTTGAGQNASDSCVDNCGDYTGSCWCDDACIEMGDCCDDAEIVCELDPEQGQTVGVGSGGYEPGPGTSSCDGLCGEAAADCFCDAACVSFGDCCSDAQTVCDLSGSDSCEGSCGDSAGSCWCDAACVEFGDCCSDAEAVCGLEPLPPGSCEGLCGGAAANCFCDEV